MHFLLADWNKCQVQKKERNVIGLNRESCTELHSNKVDGKNDM